jgi:hypothetical protein
MKDVLRMDTVHHQDVTVELSTRLLAAQREIEFSTHPTPPFEVTRVW